MKTRFDNGRSKTLEKCQQWHIKDAGEVLTMANQRSSIREQRAHLKFIFFPLFHNPLLCLLRFFEKEKEKKNYILPICGLPKKYFVYL